jgi:hypothetical protein
VPHAYKRVTLAMSIEQRRRDLDPGQPPHLDFAARMISGEDCEEVLWSGDHSDDVIFSLYEQGVTTRAQLKKQKESVIRQLPNLLRLGNELTVWMCGGWGFAIRRYGDFSYLPTFRLLEEDVDEDCDVG